MKRLTLYLLTVSFTGCVSSSAMKYPEGWPVWDTFENNECPNISGTYNDLSDPPAKEYSDYYERGHAEMSPHVAGVSLYAIISSGDLATDNFERDSGVVKIHQDNQYINLDYSFIKRCIPTGDLGGMTCGQNIPKHESLSLKLGQDYSCERDGILIEKDLDANVAAAPIPVFAAVTDERRILTLTKAEDNSLIMRSELKGGGVAVFVLIPYAGYLNTLEWWRWKEKVSPARAGHINP